MFLFAVMFPGEYVMEFPSVVVMTKLGGIILADPFCSRLEFEVPVDFPCVLVCKKLCCS